MRGTFSDLLIRGKRDGGSGALGETRSCVLTVASTWDGAPLSEAEHARIELTLDDQTLDIAVQAPFFGDPPPPGPAGPTPGLWDYEVLEVFLLGEDERYLEIELSPHGHHLALLLHGRRSVVRSGMPLSFEATRKGEHWRGRARLPADWLPPGLNAVNGYTIHGQGGDRRYRAAHPDGRAQDEERSEPDFHRLECFGPLVWRE